MGLPTGSGRDDADGGDVDGGNADGGDADGNDAGSEPRLASRVLVTWIELTVVGITGGLLGATVGGPPGFVVYLATSLVSLGIIFYNVNELVKAWMRETAADAERT